MQKSVILSIPVLFCCLNRRWKQHKEMSAFYSTFYTEIVDKFLPSSKWMSLFCKAKFYLEDFFLIIAYMQLYVFLIVSSGFKQIFFSDALHKQCKWSIFSQTGCAYISVCFTWRSPCGLTNASFPLFYRHFQNKIRGETHQSPWLLSDKLFIWRVSCLVSLVSSSSALLIWNIALHNEGEK